MGVEKGGKARIATKFFVVAGKGLQRILDTGEQQRINRLLVFPGKVSEFFGQGKGEQEVRGWQPFVQLFFDPLAAFMVLAMGTVPVATGMGNIGLFLAVMVRTLGQHMRTMLLSTLAHGPQGFFMPRQGKGLVLGKETVTELIDNRGEQDHLTPSQVISKESVRELTA
jgi:hypothetical protein